VDARGGEEGAIGVVAGREADVDERDAAGEQIVGQAVGGKGQAETRFERADHPGESPGTHRRRMQDRDEQQHQGRHGGGPDGQSPSEA